MLREPLNSFVKRIEAGLDWKGVMLCKRKNGEFLGMRIMS
jgi:hypothetical protein